MFWKTLLARQNYKENAKFLDPLLRVAEIRQPVFMIHGERDDVVYATEAREMLDALKKQGTPVQAKSFSQATHSYWPVEDRIERLNEIATFLDLQLSSNAFQAEPEVGSR